MLSLNIRYFSFYYLRIFWHGSGSLSDIFENNGYFLHILSEYNLLNGLIRSLSPAPRATRSSTSTHNFCITPRPIPVNLSNCR